MMPYRGSGFIMAHRDLGASTCPYCQVRFAKINPNQGCCLKDACKKAMRRKSEKVSRAKRERRAK